MEDHLTTLSTTVLVDITNKHEHFVGNVLSQSKENILKTGRSTEPRHRTPRDYVVDLATLTASNEHTLHKRTESRKTLVSTRKNHIYTDDSDTSDSDDAADIGRLRARSRESDRPTSRVGSYLSSQDDKPGSFFLDDTDSDTESDEDDKDDDDEWDPSKIKYTGGAELTPCFSRGSKDCLTFSDDETCDSPIATKPSFTQVCWESEGEWEGRGTEDEDWFRDEEVVDCDARSESEVWPDEMDSEDFPQLHTWAHSWIWRPTIPQLAPSFPPIPSIHFHFVESLPPDQTCWIPLQDSMFNNRLTVPGHHAYNVAHPPLLLETLVVDEEIKPLPYSCDSATPFVYSETLGHCVTAVPTLAEQEVLGVFSTPMKKRRRTPPPKTAEIKVSEPEPEEHEDRCRGRSMQRSPRQIRSSSVLSALEPPSTEPCDHDNDDEFVYCGASGCADS
ncbi:hypothetical protein FRC03_008865 [Tulasnella sp. 419]|nr:hypothetical protein FRC03_008865 [Tulasnella sp. 419]